MNTQLSASNCQQASGRLCHFWQHEVKCLTLLIDHSQTKTENPLRYELYHPLQVCSRPIECTIANFATLHPTGSRLVDHLHEMAPCLVGDTRVLHHCFSRDTFGLLQPKLTFARELLPLTKTVGSHHYQWLCVLTSPPWPRNSPSH